MSQIPLVAERRKPGLSDTLPGQRHPQTCQGCNAITELIGPLQFWRECDEWDQPIRPARIVALCASCSNRYIERHPRLYIRLETNDPEPGTMAICVDCTERCGLECESPRAKRNGGPGVEVVIQPPQAVHMCRSPRRLSGFVRFYATPATGCSGRKGPAIDNPGPTGL